MENKKIVVKKLSHVFTDLGEKAFWALQKVSATFLEKSIVAIIGSSAAGKTVFLKHLNGLLLPSEGEINIANDTINSYQKNIKNIKKIRQKVGFVFEFAEKQLFESTVENDIIFGPLNFGFSKKIAKQKALEYLNFFGLDASYLKRSPFELSGGQKRKVAIAGILAYEPDFILFDQLASGFDLAIKKSFFNFLFQLKATKKKTIIFTSNNVDDVLALADKVMVLKEGQLINFISPQKLFLDFSFCAQNDIVLPKTLQFLQKLKSYGFDFAYSNFNFKNEQTLIADLVTYFKKLKEKQSFKEQKNAS